MNRKTPISTGKLAFLIIGGVLAYLFVFSPKKMGSMTFLYTQAQEKQPAKVDTCLAKEKCIHVYVATWCPACKQSKQVLKIFGDYLIENPQQQVGIRIFVGPDQADAIAMADEIGNTAVVDKNNYYKKTARPQAVPNFKVTNRKGEIIQTQEGILRNASPQQFLEWLQI